MKAVVLTAPGGIENLQLAEIETPTPAADEVRIRVMAAGFNPADYRMRQGALADHGVAKRGPIILGGEVAGVIDAVGSDVADFQVGEAVCGYLPLKRGGYAEAVCSHTAFLALKPENVSFIQAAAIPLAGLTAFTCVRTAMGRPGAPLFIAGGSGGVGGFAIALAKAEGASRIITTAGSDSSATYLTDNLGMSPDSIVRYDKIEDQQLASRIRAMNSDRLFPLALDFVGTRMLTLCCELVDFDGCVMSIVQRAGNEDQELIASKCAAFRFVRLQDRAKHSDRSAWLEYGRNLRTILDLISRGRVRLPHIEEVGAFSTESVRAAHRLLEGKHVQGKLVMSVP